LQLNSFVEIESSANDFSN